MKIRKALIAVAGYGTRFLPATKVQPKEMLPIVDKPIVQYLVEEAVHSGIEDIILVVRSGTQSIADHFDSSRELEVHLEEQKKADYLKIVQDLPKLAHFAVVRQARHLPYGNGSPILAAKSFLYENEPFVYMFGDDLVLSDTPCTRQLLKVHAEHQPDAVIAFQEVPHAEIRHYAAAKLKPHAKLKEIESLVEKPSPDQAPSDLAQLGRFILPWTIVGILEDLSKEIRTKGQELYLTYALDRLCGQGKVLAHAIEGTWLTTGDPLRFLKANVEYALRHPGIGKEFAEYLRELDERRRGIGD
ncbi:MAG: UTP--glucose-1-phosphate uridylyltransferase [Thermoguttaceae bacterium]